MTVAVSNSILKGSFEDGPRMEKLDLVFAQRYLDAWHAYQQGLPCSASWKWAFDECKDPSLTVIQQLVMGINTHINLDLAIASALVAPGGSIHALQNDFDKINDVIGSLVGDIKECLSEVWVPMRTLTRIANHRQEAVLNFSIDLARKTAWANAVVLANMQPAEQQVHVGVMDRMVLQLAHKISSPGLLAEVLMRTIRLSEWGEVSRTIRLIDTTVVEGA